MVGTMDNQAQVLARAPRLIRWSLSNDQYLWMRPEEVA